MISLQKRLVFRYALFMVAVLAVVALGVTLGAVKIFDGYVQAAIARRNAEIVRAVGDVYNSQQNPLQKGFDISALEALGMVFMHEGYVIDVEDASGEAVWDARLMDMRHCVAVLNGINARMQRRFGRAGGIQNIGYPVRYHGETVGQVNIATVGPFFYTEADALFLRSLIILLIAAALVFIGLGVAVSVKALLGELAEGERRQRQLSGDIAHELRTPLTCLRGNIEAMIDGIWAPTPERLISCHEELQRLSTLIEDLRILNGLEWEQITLHKTDFDLAGLAAHVAADWTGAAHEKGVAMILNTEAAPVFADYDRVKQVLINLVSNAVKYTDRGSITITVTPRELTITDSGAGIARSDLPHIFERFYRTDKSRARSSGGSGIGLTIAAAIAAAHGWNLGAESEEGKGSRFRVGFSVGHGGGPRPLAAPLLPFYC
jgi:signal transduction histidine kinase